MDHELLLLIFPHDAPLLSGCLFVCLIIIMNINFFRTTSVSDNDADAHVITVTLYCCTVRKCQYKGPSILCILWKRACASAFFNDIGAKSQNITVLKVNSTNHERLQLAIELN